MSTYTNLIVCGLVLLLGCDDPLLCDRENFTFEVTNSDDIAELDDYRQSGWECSGAGTIRNGAGSVIGYRYDCTICR